MVLLTLCSRDVAAAATLSSPPRAGRVDGRGGGARMPRSLEGEAASDRQAAAGGRPAAGPLGGHAASGGSSRQQPQTAGIIATLINGYGTVLSRTSLRVSELPLWAMPQGILEGGLMAAVRSSSSISQIRL